MTTSDPRDAAVADGRFAYAGLDRVIHERARLSLLTALVTQPKGLAFNDLKRLCALTDGNLARHLQVLEEAALVEILKDHEGARTQTRCRVTRLGRRRYLDYLAVLERVVRDAAAAEDAAAADNAAGGKAGPSRLAPA